MFRDVSKDGSSFIFRVKHLKCFQVTLLSQRNNHHNHLKVVISLSVPSEFAFNIRILTALYFFVHLHDYYYKRLFFTMNGDYYNKRLFFTMNGDYYNKRRLLQQTAIFLQ